MRRRFALLSSLAALVLVLALPGTTLASSFTYTVKSDECTASGGQFGYGHLYFEVKLTEYGWSGANKFTFAGTAQHRNLGSSRWRTDWNAGTFTYRFTNNGANTNYTRWYDYSPNDFAWHRMTVTLKVWHNGVLLAKKTIHGDYC